MDSDLTRQTDRALEEGRSLLRDNRAGGRHRRAPSIGRGSADLKQKNLMTRIKLIGVSLLGIVFIAMGMGLVLEQIGALNTTTAGMIDSTGEMLRTQTGAIHEQAASSTIPLETLQRAFQNIYDTMDAVDTFKVKALANMKQTVDVLTTEVEKSKGYIARAEGQAQASRSAQEPSLLTAD